MGMEIGPELSAVWIQLRLVSTFKLEYCLPVLQKSEVLNINNLSNNNFSLSNNNFS